MMRTVTVRCTWESEHEIEVPDDFEHTGHLNDFPEDALEQMTPHAASLIDWTVR